MFWIDELGGNSQGHRLLTCVDWVDPYYSDELIGILDAILESA